MDLCLEFCFWSLYIPFSLHLCSAVGDSLQLLFAFSQLFCIIVRIVLGKILERYFQGKLLSVSPQWSHHFSASSCSFSYDLKFVSVRVFGRLLFRRMFSLVFVFLCTSFVFVLPLAIAPLLWVLAWLDMMRVLWGCQPS